MKGMGGESKARSAMTKVASLVAPSIESAGFTRRGFTFNRSRENGVVAVLDLQMGRSDPPGSHQTPGSREDLYGSFTVNLGIVFEEVWGIDLATGDKAFPSFVSGIDGHIRARLGRLRGPDAEDLWWSLKTRSDEVAGSVGDLIDRLGLPWLSRLDTRRGALTTWEQHHEISPGQAPRLPFIIASIYLHEGQAHEGRETFMRYYRDAPLSHAQWLYSVAPRLGLQDVPPPERRAM